LNETTNESAAPRPVQSWRWRLAALAGVLVLAGLAWYGGRRLLAPVPPPVPAEADEADVVQAIDAARRAVVRDPYDGAAWGKLAAVLLANGYQMEAAPCLEQAERLDPDELAWPYLLALHHLRTDRQEALRHLRRAVERGDRARSANVTPRLLLAEMLLENGETAASQALCDAVLAREPDNPRARLLQGTLARAADDLAASITHLSQAAGSPAARKKAYIQLAAVHQRLGNEELARDYGRRAQEQPPEPGWPDPVLAQVGTETRGRQAQQRQADRFKAQGQTAERVRVLREIAAHSTDAKASVELALALTEAGDRAGAEEALREAVRRQPDRFSAHYLLVIALFEQGEQLRKDSSTAGQARSKYEEAAAVARTVIQSQPGRAPPYYFLGRCLHRLGQLAPAADALRQAVALRPQEVAFRLELAQVLADDGQDALAVAQLEQAQAFVADNARVRELLERLRKRAGK
jgi:tetratricopeptide (TPR) repeat protein